MSVLMNSENQLDSENNQEMYHPVDGYDTKYVSGLSTILVATIQEAKDRISQVEYIFCSQLYPNFQKNSKCVQKLYSEARKAVEDEFKVRFSEVENQFKEVCVEKERAIERVAELEEMLVKKTKTLLDLADTNASVVRSKEMETKEKEEKMNLLLEKFRALEEKTMVLNKKVHQKSEEVSKEKKSKEELLKQIELQLQIISGNEQVICDSEKEKKQLAMKLENLEASFSGVQEELRRKTLEVEELTHFREQLVRQVKKNEIELTTRDKKLSECEKEKQSLLSRIDLLEHRNRITEIPSSSDLVEQLRQKNVQFEIESQKRKDITAAYKKLKSQQIFLLKKLSLTSEEMLLQMKAEEEGNNKSSNDNKFVTPPEIKREVPVNNVLAIGLTKVKEEVDYMESSDDEISGRLNQMSNSHAPSSSPAAANWTSKKNLSTSAGIKRPAPGWRETRSRQSPAGADPHDDFLDTPYENIKGNLHKAFQDNVHNLPAHNSKEADSDGSDDETQDMAPQPVPDKQRLKSPRSGPASFKFVEPVRKKAERENLNGVECKQCKKFYDAVLCDAEDKDGEVNKQNLRCEHHDGVSRHRYRYVPPMTPEGFWNIGFDTES